MEGQARRIRCRLLNTQIGEQFLTIHAQSVASTLIYNLLYSPLARFTSSMLSSWLYAVLTCEVESLYKGPTLMVQQSVPRNQVFIFGTNL